MLPRQGYTQISKSWPTTDFKCSLSQSCSSSGIRNAQGSPRLPNQGTMLLGDYAVRMHLQVRRVRGALHAPPKLQHLQAQERFSY